SGAGTESNSGVNIGNYRSSDSNHHNGDLADARIFDRTLTQSQVQEVMAEGVDSDPELASVDVQPFSIFTDPVSTGTDISTLTVSTAAQDYDWSGMSLQRVRDETTATTGPCTLI